MNGSFLLDTNIVIGILEGDKAITRKLYPQMRLYLTSIVMGELFFGAHRSGRVHHNLERLRLLSKAYPVLPCDLGTAETYGKLKDELRKKGRPVPDNDIWIAAVTERHQLTLITRDQHFREFDSLDTDIW